MKLVYISILALALSLVGCKSNDFGQYQELANAPKWVTDACSKERETLCGVGVGGSERGPSFARKLSATRARDEIADSLRVVTKSMVKDYQGTVGITGSESEDDQFAQAVSKHVTSATLEGTVITALWRSPSGDMYTLVTLDVDRYNRTVQQMSRLDPKVRDAITARAAEAFNELNES